MYTVHTYVQRLLALCKLLHKISCWTSSCDCWKEVFLEEGQIIDVSEKASKEVTIKIWLGTGHLEKLEG